MKMNVWLAILVVMIPAGAEAFPLTGKLKQDTRGYPDAKKTAEGSNPLTRGRLVVATQETGDMYQLATGEWVAKSAVDLKYDRAAELKQKQNLTWFFERYGDGTAYEVVSLTPQELGPAEIKDIILSAPKEHSDSMWAAHYLLRNSIMGKPITSEVPELKLLQQKSYWLGFRAVSEDLLDALPADWFTDREFCERMLRISSRPRVYARAAQKFKEDPKFAGEVLKGAPDSYRQLVPALQDNVAFLKGVVSEMDLHQRRAFSSILKRLKPALHPQIFPGGAPQ
jgi:hypothetical protein